MVDLVTIYVFKSIKYFLIDNQSLLKKLVQSVSSSSAFCFCKGSRNSFLSQINYIFSPKSWINREYDLPKFPVTDH